MYKKVNLLQNDTLKIISPKIFKSVLKKLEIQSLGFIQRAEIDSIHEKLPALDGIVTGAVSLKDGPAILFFRANGEIIQWQQGVRDMVAKIVKEVKAKAAQPLGISPFYAVSDGKPNGFGRYMSDKIRTELSKQGVKTISLEELPQIMQQWKLQLAGITDQNTAVKIGKLANAKMMLMENVAGSLSSS